MEFAVLGEVRASRAGQPIALGGPQQRRLLAVLLANTPRSVALERIIEVMWDDSPPDGARRTTMSYISRLRGALGPDRVDLVDTGYRLVVADSEVDADRFERLVEQSRVAPPTEAITLLDQALGLWQGPCFGEFSVSWWAIPMASRLEEMRLSAEEERIDVLLAIDRIEQATAQLELLTAAHPLRPGFTERLMRASAIAGREAEALRAMSTYRRHLAEETGLDPPAALVELERLILSQEYQDHELAARPPVRGYRLGDCLGSGAHGVVYRSVQPGVGRSVAVKIVKPEFADNPEFIDRFEREAQLITRLEHPHIVPLYDFWREPGGAFLVFRLLTGGTLKEALERDGPWSVAQVVRLMEEIGGALSTAHNVGVVHRDVKPSNILLDGAGHAYLSDFGIATLGIDDAHGEAAVYPSPYSPPELNRGTAWTPRSDQYSFALVLDEVLTGSSDHGHVAPAGNALTGVIADLVAVIERATDADPARRFASIDEMLLACRSVLAPELAPIDATLSRRQVINPYVGLRPFDEADAWTFYARGELVAALVEHVTRDRFVAVVGASGSGKSSILHAGLVPTLRRQDRPVVTMVPGTAPQDRLHLALAGVARNEVAGATLTEMVSSVSTQAEEPLVLIIDQFEELWTVTDAAARREFIADLRALIESDVNCSVVIALRADFYDRPLATSELGELMAVHTFAVRPMNALELREAIVGPAAAAGVLLEAGLDTELVADIVDQPASLPLLQFTLRDLFDRRRKDVITLDAYHELGGVVGAVASRAEQLYETLDAVDADLARHVFLRLIVTGAATTTRVGVHDAVSSLRASAPLLDLFVEHRLITTDIDPATREPTYALAHESLISSWPRLGAWLADGRNDRRIVQQLSAAAAAWDDRGRQDADLYRGGRLDAAEEAAGTATGAVTALEHEFLTASRASVNLAIDADDRRRRRLRRRLVATSVALVIASLAGAIALAQRREARDQADAASVARLVALSQSLTASKRDVAALVALEASMRAPGAATDGAMMSALYSEPSFLGDLRPPFAVQQIDIGRDGRTLWGTPASLGDPVIRIDLEGTSSTTFEVPGQGELAVTSLEPVDDQRILVVLDDYAGGDAGKRLHLVDIETSTPLASVQLDKLIVDMQVSPSGDQVAVTTVGDSNTAASVVVFDLPDLDLVAAVEQPGPIELLNGQSWYSFSTWIDDDSIAVGSTSGRIMIWQPESGDVVKRINDPPAPGVGQVANRLVLSPDGSTLVAADHFADGSHGDGLMAFDLATGAAQWDRSRAANPMFAIDGDKQVVYAQEAGPGSSRLFSFDLATGQRLERILDGQHGSACSVAVAPDMSRLVLASCNDTSISTWALNGTTPAGPSSCRPRMADRLEHVGVRRIPSCALRPGRQHGRSRCRVGRTAARPAGARLRRLVLVPRRWAHAQRAPGRRRDHRVGSQSHRNRADHRSDTGLTGRHRLDKGRRHRRRRRCL